MGSKEVGLLMSGKIKWIIVLLVIVLTLTTCDKKLPFPFQAIGFTSQKSLVDTAFNRLFDQQIERNLNSTGCPGVAVLVMQNDQIIFEKTYGIRSRYSSDSINTGSIFRLGSVSKGFAGILAAILIDKKVIGLDDPLVLYIPELKIQAKSKDHILKVRHILTHSTGLTEHAYSNLVDENKNMETIISYLNKLTPRDSTGKAYAYQNAAYGLIEKVVESATGMSYARALDYYLFSPLSMCSTSCTYEDVRYADNVCTGHRYYGSKKGYLPIELKPHYYNVASAGGINAPLSDMAKWLKAVMGYRPDVISPNARNIAFTPYINTSSDDRYFNNWPGIKDTHYGLGWRLINTKNNQLAYHGGLVNGFRTEIAFDKEQNIGVVFLFNSLCGYSSKAVHEFYELWNTYHAGKEQNIDIL
ncbi:MAG: serine hydrolase domain-containing protein [Saprospiraceae bacterium]